MDVNYTAAKDWQWCSGCGNLWRVGVKVNPCECPGDNIRPFPPHLWEAVSAAYKFGGGSAVHAIERELYLKALKPTAPRGKKPMGY